LPKKKVNVGEGGGPLKEVLQRNPSSPKPNPGGGGKLGEAVCPYYREESTKHHENPRRLERRKGKEED